MDQRDGVASGARHILVIPGRLLSGSYVDGIAKRTSGRPRQGSRYNQPFERGEGNSWPGVMGIALSWLNALFDRSVEFPLPLFHDDCRLPSRKRMIERPGRNEENKQVGVMMRL